MQQTAFHDPTEISCNPYGCPSTHFENHCTKSVILAQAPPNLSLGARSKIWGNPSISEAYISSFALLIFLVDLGTGILWAVESAWASYCTDTGNLAITDREPE